MRDMMTGANHALGRNHPLVVTRGHEINANILRF